MCSALGLTARPPHCDISVPSPDAGLADIQPTDLEDVPAFDKVITDLLLNTCHLYLVKAHMSTYMHALQWGHVTFHVYKRSWAPGQ